MRSTVASFMLLRFLIFFFILLAIDWYFFQSVKTITYNIGYPEKNWIYRIYWGVSVLSLLLGLVMILTYNKPFIPRGFMLYAVSFMMVLVCSKLIGSVFLLLDDLGRVSRWIWGFFSTNKETFAGNSDTISRGKFLSYCAVGLASLPFVSLLYGMAVTAFDFTFRRLKIYLPNLPKSFEGLKIIQISDLHSGSFVSSEPFIKAVELIMAEKPDVIFFTGDLVNDRSSEAEPFIEIWRKLQAPLGVFSILGNHDYGDYVIWDTVEEKVRNLERLKEIHAEMGWDLLLNEFRILEKAGEKVGLIGVENWGNALRFPRKGDIEKASKGMPDVPVKILLTHDPSHWDAQVRPNHPDIGLTLSGHTHGFQFGIEIPGFRWSPSQWVYKQWAGLYEKDNQKIYVNRGLGFIGYLGRVGIKPEITVLELTAKK